MDHLVGAEEDELLDGEAEVLGPFAGAARGQESARSAHSLAAGEIERRLSRAERMLVAAPALVEAYAVLTRLPPPHRLSPQDALALLAGNFMGTGRIVALGHRAYRTLLCKAPGGGIAGGQIYDAVIAACALKVRGMPLLTFNPGPFLSCERKGVEVVVPGQA